MNAIELLEIGDSLGLILPEEVLQRLKVGVGDTLYVTQAARGFNLTTVDPQSSPTLLEGLDPTDTQNKK